MYRYEGVYRQPRVTACENVRLVLYLSWNSAGRDSDVGNVLLFLHGCENRGKRSPRLAQKAVTHSQTERERLREGNKEERADECIAGEC